MTQALAELDSQRQLEKAEAEKRQRQLLQEEEARTGGGGGGSSGWGGGSSASHGSDDWSLRGTGLGRATAGSRGGGVLGGSLLRDTPAFVPGGRKRVRFGNT